MADTYTIFRFYQKPGKGRRELDTGLTLDEARAHCRSPEASSTTCTSAAGKARTRNVGAWFDGYDSE